MQPTFVYTCMYINKSTNFGPFELCPERLMEMIGWTETIAGLLAQSGGDGPSAPPLSVKIFVQSSSKLFLSTFASRTL